MPRLALLSLLAGCAAPLQSLSRVEKPDRVDLVAVADPVFLADVPGAVDGDVLWAGAWVGDVLFAGGYVEEERDGGLEHRSRDIALGQEETYRRQIRDVVSGCLGDALGPEGRKWVAAGAVDPGRVPPPRRRDMRGTGAEDGHDNQALPRFELTPGPMEGVALPAGADALLLPIVVHYYAHNGGWFLGQTYGNSGGARVRLLWTLYGPDGRVLGYGDHQAKYEDHGNFSPNSAEVQDYLIAVEERLCRDLDHAL